MKNLFLCGFMGCGKSSLGSAAAKKLGCPFIDLDRYIVEQAGMSVPEIFDTFGEAGFRERETQALKDLNHLNGVIVATGGGALVNPENASLCRERGLVLYIDVEFDTCYRRIRGDANRPLAAKPLPELRQLYQTRKLSYIKNSDLTIRNTFFKQTVDELVRIARQK